MNEYFPTININALRSFKLHTLVIYVKKKTGVEKGVELALHILNFTKYFRTFVIRVESALTIAYSNCMSHNNIA